MNLAAEHDADRIGPDRLAEQIEQLPALPEVVMDLLQNIDREDVDIGVLARKMSHDQTLTAKALRFANSPFYGTQGKISSIQQAITLLGMKTVRQILTAAALASVFPDNRCKGFEFRAFWRHAMGTAICARLLARMLHLNQDFAFTAGLLHDIGRLVLVTRFPHSYEQVIAYRDEHDIFLLDAERSILGTDHVAVGLALAERWRFPEVIRHAIAGHHTPEPLGSSSIASLVNVANGIVHALDLAAVDNDLVPPVSLDAWRNVGLDDAAYLRLFRETEVEFEKISSIL